MRAGSVLLLSLALAAAACQKEARPPAPPRKCGKVERGSDRILDVVLCAEADTDEDSVDDAVDLCLEHKETLNGVADKDGCPDPDRDQDLFVDYEDTCPEEAGVAPDGCPGKDTDKDLIADHLDSCPYEKEDMDGDQDADGCPDGERDESVAKALNQQLWQRARVDVRRGRASATKAGTEALEDLAKTVATRPSDVARVRIVGYAALREARRGKAKDLAKNRVKLVEARLAAAGIDPKAFERAIYPLQDKRERVGRVDVMVFLDLKAAMADEARSASLEPTATQPEVTTAPAATTAPTAIEPTTTEPSTEAATPDPAPEDGPSSKPPAVKEPDAEGAKAPVEAYPEPEKPAADEDWDLTGSAKK